ncbi:MAG: hypothetical protein ACOYN6_09470 [Ignavibacteria bacterium]
MDKRIKDFSTGLSITMFFAFLFGYIFFQNSIFVPNLTTFSITIAAITGSIFFWTMVTYDLKVAVLTQLFLLIALFVIFKNSMNVHFIILESLVFLSITASIYVNYIFFAPRIKQVFLPFTLPVLIIVFSAIALTINYTYIIITTSRVNDLNLLLKVIVIEIVQNEVLGLGLGIGIFVSGKFLKKNSYIEKGN